MKTWSTRLKEQLKNMIYDEAQLKLLLFDVNFAAHPLPTNPLKYSFTIFFVFEHHLRSFFFVKTSDNRAFSRSPIPDLRSTILSSLYSCKDDSTLFYLVHLKAFLLPFQSILALKPLTWSNIFFHDVALCCCIKHKTYSRYIPTYRV